MEESAAILATLQALGSEEHRQSKARLGVPLTVALGVPLPAIRSLGKEIGHNQGVALELWASGYHEARLLAALVADPKQLDTALVEQWVSDVVPLAPDLETFQGATETQIDTVLLTLAATPGLCV